MNINWKKEVISWTFIIGTLGVLYFTNFYAPVVGKIQSWILATHIFTPNLGNTTKIKFKYDGKLISPDGQIVDYLSLKEKTIFINYWATWCPPCLAEMPHIESLYQEFKNNPNVVFLLISKDRNFEKAVDFIDKKEYQVPIFKEIKTPTQLQTTILPTTIVIKNKLIVFKKEGMSNFNTADFKSFLSE